MGGDSQWRPRWKWWPKMEIKRRRWQISEAERGEVKNSVHNQNGVGGNGGTGLISFSYDCDEIC